MVYITDENGNLQKVEEKVSYAAPATVSIKLDEVNRMADLIKDALDPKVTFKEDMFAMREEAERVSRQSIKIVRDMLSPYASPKLPDYS